MPCPTPALHQRCARVEEARRGAPHARRARHAPRQPDPLGSAPPGDGVPPCDAIPSGISGPGAVLPAGRERPSAVAGAPGDAPVPGEDACEEPSHAPDENPPHVSGHGGNPTWPPQRLGGATRTRGGPHTADGPVWRYRPPLVSSWAPHRPAQGGGGASECGGPPSPCADRRALWLPGALRRPPHPQAGGLHRPGRQEKPLGVPRMVA
jgi:hypothetical protein